MEDPKNRINTVNQLVHYCKINPNAVVYIDNDCVFIYDPDHEDVWMDIHPNILIGDLLNYLSVPWKNV